MTEFVEIWGHCQCTTDELNSHHEGRNRSKLGYFMYIIPSKGKIQRGRSGRAIWLINGQVLFNHPVLELILKKLVNNQHTMGGGGRKGVGKPLLADTKLCCAFSPKQRQWFKAESPVILRISDIILTLSPDSQQFAKRTQQKIESKSVEYRTLTLCFET